MSTELKLLYYLCMSNYLNDIPEEDRLQKMLDLNEAIKDILLSIDLYTLHKYSPARTLIYLLAKDNGYLTTSMSMFLKHNGFDDIVSQIKSKLLTAWSDYLWGIDRDTNPDIHYKFLRELQKYLNTT